MKENYFKSYFKTSGLLTTIIAILAFAVVGYLSIFTKAVNTNLANIITGVVIAALGCFALIGFSGLKREKCGFVDFLRVVGFIASLVLLIMCAAKGGHGLLLTGFAVECGLLFIQVALRFVFCQTYDEDASFKNYFGTLAGKYNPLVILVAGAVVAFIAVILFKTDALTGIEALKNYMQYKYVFFGGVIALVVMMIILGLDKSTDVNFFDLILSVLFVASAYLCVFTAPAGLTNSIVPFLLIVFGLSIGTAMLIRAILYNKGKGYSNPAHKIRTYFKSVYDEYDVTIPLFCSLVVILLVLIGAGKLYGDKTLIINRVWKAAASDGAIMALYIIALVIGLCGVVLTLVFRKFKAQSAVRTDDILVGLLFASFFVVLYGIVMLAFTKHDFFGNTANIILFIGYTLIFAYSAIVQFIRLKKFEPIQAVITAAPKVEEEEAVQEEAEEEEAVEEEVKEEEVKEEENNDPFALTEEDEALFNSYYGAEATEEEQPQEEVVEEVVEEEEPVEEVQEEEVVEEVVEEQPAEEVTEEVVEEEAEEEAEEEEEEAEEEEAEEENPEEDGEPVEEVQHEAHKEENIVVQDFQVLDENGEVRKIKRKFLTKMMFAPYQTKEYYNEIKNYLGLYRAKGRQSARCESFRYKGLVAKVALGGKSVKVFLAIDPSFIDENPKYHLKDVSEKKQYQEVPVMMKVRSDRGLKYFKELVDYMFATRGVKPKRNYENVDYLPTLIPNGEAILATLGMSTYYLQNSMNAKGIPDEMPDNLEDYLPMIPGEELPEGEEIEATVYLDTLCNHFEDGNEVTIDVLKSLHIVTRGNVLRVKARGTLDKKLIIYAEYFDEDALKMLMCTNCTAVKVVR